LSGFDFARGSGQFRSFTELAKARAKADGTTVRQAMQTIARERPDIHRHQGGIVAGKPAASKPGADFIATARGLAAERGISVTDAMRELSKENPALHEAMLKNAAARVAQRR